MESTLILNASTEPLQVVSARRAIQLIMGEKAIALDNSEKFFHAADSMISVPYVVQLLEQRNIKRNFDWNRRSFSRRGVMVRDDFKCVYCGKRATTIDHVLPRMLGGVDSYENCVACCSKCNSKKGHKTLEQIGWTVPDIRYRATPSPYYGLLFKTKRNTAQWTSWKPYVEMWSGEKTMLFA